MEEIKCNKCGKLLVKVERKVEIKCSRCKTKVKYDTKEDD